MSIQLKGSDDSVYSNDIIAPNIPTQGQIAGYQRGTIVPELGRWVATSQIFESVPGTMQNPIRRSGRWSRVGDQVTYMFDWTGAIDWGQIQSQSWRTDELAFTAPYANTTDPYLQPHGIYRVWKTLIPHDDNTFCAGVMSTAIGPAVMFQQVYNNGAQSTGASWELWRQGQSGGGDNFELQVNLTYFTDDTTWTPLNGATVS